MIGPTYTPLDGELFLDGTFFTTPWTRVTVETISKYAGSAIGNAVVTFRSRYARDAEPQMGRRARLKIGSTVVLSGVAADAPALIDQTQDEYSLTIYCDKWLMSGRTIGQIGIGTVGTPVGDDGFADVGFDIVMNRDGAGNRLAGAMDFCTGSAAVQWSLKAALQFVFTHYVPGTVATLDPDILSGAYDLVPSHLELTGLTALQAIDTIVQLAGESWGLKYTTAASEFVSVCPGAGTSRTISFFPPRGGASAEAATAYHPQSARIGRSLADCRDVIQAISAPITIEHTYSTNGADPLLKRDAAFVDKEYAARYRVDVSKYAAHKLGRDLSAGSQPKPWLNNLVTRLKADGSAYVTKAEIDITPALRRAQPVPDPVIWVSLDSGTTWRLCTGGFRMDVQHGTIDLSSTLDLLDTAGEKQPTEVTSWTTVGVACTTATIIGLPESKETALGSRYLPTPFLQMIVKSDAVPEYRYRSYVPDLASSDTNARELLAPTDVEKYIDVSEALQDAADAALQAADGIAVDVQLGFEFMPLFEIGDQLVFGGRDLGLVGRNPVVRSVSYSVHHAYQTHIEASNVTASIDPDKMLYTEVG